jgi:hypothetical protein
VVAGGLSPLEAQGQLTEADETVGEITLGGTFSIVVFAGLLGGVVALALYLVSRPWLPATARSAGVVVGLLVMGIVGPGDPLDPDNIDFVLLSFDSLTVALIIAGSALFGLVFASLAARFELAPLAVAASAYLGGRALFPGRLRAVLDLRAVQVAGRTLLSVAALVAIARLLSVAVTVVAR